MLTFCKPSYYDIVINKRDIINDMESFKIYLERNYLLGISLRLIKKENKTYYAILPYKENENKNERYLIKIHEIVNILEDYSKHLFVHDISTDLFSCTLNLKIKFIFGKNINIYLNNKTTPPI